MERLVSHIPFFAASPKISEYVYPNSDYNIAVWQTNANTTTNLYQRVDDVSNDSDYIKLRNANWVIDVCPTTATRTFEFDMASPSATPGTAGQSATVIIRGKVVDPYTTGFTATLDVYLYEGATLRASDTGNTVSTTYVDHSLSLTAGQIGSVTDWNNVRVRGTFNMCASGIDADLDAQVSSVYIQFY